MKSRKVMTILLSLAIMFTFMPAMAFAADSEPVWDYQNHTVTYDGQTYGGVEVNFVSSTGLLQATYSDGTRDLESDQFYDLTDAVIYGTSDGTAIATNMTYSAYTALDGAENMHVTLKKPSYATQVDGTTSSSSATASNVTLTGWQFTGSVAALEESETTQTGTVSVSLSISGTSSSDRYEILQGSVADKSVYVQGTTVKPSDSATFYDGTTGYTSTYNGKYDGKSHTFAVKSATGYTTVYKKLNTKTAAWETIDSITVKDVADNGEYAAWFEKSGSTTVKAVFKVAMTAAENKAQVKWAAPNYEGDNTYYLTEAQAADPTAFIEIFNGFTDAKDVDVEELKTVFNDFYTVKVTKNALEASQLTWKIESKYSDETALAKAVKAEYAAHKTLFDNYGGSATVLPITLRNDAQGKMNVVIKSEEDTKLDDISFSGQTKYVYKGSKTTKKGKLKAKKTITVTATADSGKDITYVATKTAGGKISVSAEGVITVKKGLAKGTYKVTVKAKTAAGNGYYATSEKQDYIIVIKK